MAAALSKPVSAEAQLFGYGLLFGGAAIVGKLMIDGLIENMDEAKARREFIGPVQEKRAPATRHSQLSDVVRLAALGFSIYNLLKSGPDLVTQWGQIQGAVKQLTQ